MSADSRHVVQSLHLYPIKGCAGIAVQSIRLDAFGFTADRQWLLTRPDGRFVTQRELPSMATVRPAPFDGGLRIEGPGVAPLIVTACDAHPVTVTCWNDRCAAFDAGDEAADWFSALLGRPLRLVRFDDRQPRHGSARWTGDHHGQPGAWSRFTDGYPLLLLSQASVQGVNERRAAEGLAPIGAERFRPNIVVSAEFAHEEDTLATLSTADIELKRVKPCTRCQVVDVDPTTGIVGNGVLDLLATYRASATMDGALTFGQNCVITRGIGQVLRVGMTLDGRYDFDA